MVEVLEYHSRSRIWAWRAWRAAERAATAGVGGRLVTLFGLWRVGGTVEDEALCNACDVGYLREEAETSAKKIKNRQHAFEHDCEESSRATNGDDVYSRLHVLVGGLRQATVLRLQHYGYNTMQGSLGVQYWGGVRAMRAATAWAATTSVRSA